MAKQSPKVPKKATENKKEAEPSSNPTVHNQTRKRATAKVTSITTDGFWLCVSGTDYFMAFDHFPWFRYASDVDIKRISVSRNCDPDNDGEFSIEWPLLDVLLGTKHIERHSQNPIKLPHPVVYPVSEGKLSNRVKETSGNEQQYEVETSFTFKGKFTVTAECAEHARQIVEQRCRADIGGVVIDVHIPFNEIAWHFYPFRADAEVGDITEVEG